MSVFVTGATGYVALHVIQQLVKTHHVIGSVRTAEKGEALKAYFPSNFTYVVVEDISQEGAFDAALQSHPEATGFIHVASPCFIPQSNFEEELMVPAIDGTVNTLKSLLKYGNIRRVVVTSSYAALRTFGDSATHLDGSSWSSIPRSGHKDGFSAYLASKTYAEKALWDFVKDNKPKFTVNSVVPCFILGPWAFDGEFKVFKGSNRVLGGLLNLKEGDPIPAMAGAFIDVRDVARAHIYALASEDHSYRMLVEEGDYSAQLCLDIINKRFPDLNLPKGDVGVLNVNNPVADVSRLKKHIKDLIPLETSVVDAVNQYQRSLK